MLLLLLKDNSFVVDFFSTFEITIGETIRASVILGVLIVLLSLFILARGKDNERPQRIAVSYFWMGLMTLLLSIPIAMAVLFLFVLFFGGISLFYRPPLIE